jgi:cytochrome c oxidase subunit 2
MTLLHALSAVVGLAPTESELDLPHGEFRGASTVAGFVDWHFWAITWLCVFFFVLIIVVMFWFMWKYRRVSHVSDTQGPTHHTPLEVTWTVIPLILVVGIFWIGMKGYIQLRNAPLNSYEVHVTAQQWSWNFTHPNGVSEAVLLLPLSEPEQGNPRPVKLLMQSQDVLHSFYVPHFRVKHDVVPGRVTSLWFEPLKPGLYDVICAEFCGRDHSRMMTKIEVLPQDEFDVEMDRRVKLPELTPDADLWWKLGPKVYNQCASCHSIDGRAGTGPTFAGLWDKLVKGDERFTDGTMLADLVGEGKMYPTTEDYVLQSIWFPQEKIVENYSGAMPTFKGLLSERKRLAILRYIQELSRDPGNFNPNGTIKNPPQPSAAPAPAPADSSASAASP